MKTRILAIPLIAAALVSCEKAKKLASEASSAVSERISKASGKDESGKVDEELQKLVDQTSEGAIFRKDQPFPKRLEIKTNRRHDLSGRFMLTSEIENRTAVVNGAQITLSKLERAGDQVRYTLEDSSFTLPTQGEGEEEGEETKAADPLEQAAPSARPLNFRKIDGKWKFEGGDFRSAVLNKELAPGMDVLLMDSALAPRSMWFAKRRLKIGDKVDVAGDMIALLLPGEVEGRLAITLESFEPVAGHPCGVFSVVGDYSRKNFPDFEGNTMDEEVTIESGKLWLSLLYPVVLKEELETITTFKSGGQGGRLARGQGAVKVSVTRDWKILK